MKKINFPFFDISKAEEGFSQFACKNCEVKRIAPDPFEGGARPNFSCDAHKIINSLAYARYVGKTQVFALFESDHISRRILHVQLVSKIGRLIGRYLKLNQDLIEAIALGHDIGHVPYGHEGEKFLDDISQKNKIGYFCHNAQSVKFLNEIENGGKGLNLSLQVLDGILAHNGEILLKKYIPDYKKTNKQYMEEYENCFREKDFSKKILPMTLEGCVVKIADVISYLGRDMEDAIILKIIRRKDIPLSVKKILGNTNFKITDSLISDLIKNSYGKNYVCFSKDIFKALKELMVFNYEKIYLNPRIKTELSKVEKAFYGLFEKYLNDLR
ncbi:phosphohydrolase, partial [Candidatus Parcubacteria bacterium A4]